MVTSDGVLEGINVDNLEGTVSVIEDGIRQFPDGDVLGATYGGLERIKIGGYALGNALGAEVVYDVVSSDVMPDGDIVGNLGVY